MKVILALISAAVLLGGCASIQTTSVSTPKQDPGGEGIEYFLPTGEFELQVWDVDGRLVVALGGPLFMPDYNGRMRTKLLPGRISDNAFKLAVGPNGLLTSFSGSSEGKFDKIIEAAIKSGFGIQSSSKPTGEPFFSQTFSLTEIDDVEKAALDAIERHKQAICALPADTNGKNLHCQALTQSFIAMPGARFIDIHTPATNEYVSAMSPDATRTVTCPPDALCYRPLAPVKLTLKLANGASTSDVFLIPDMTRVSHVRAPGGVFVKQEYNVAFTNGVLTTYDRTSRSEMVGLVSLPLTVVKSVIAAPAELLASRKTALEAEKAYLDAVRNNVDSKVQTRAKCKDQPALCSGTTYRILRVEAGEELKVDAAEKDDPTGPVQ
jgi:hypothetical protein